MNANRQFIEKFLGISIKQIDKGNKIIISVFSSKYESDENYKKPLNEVS